MWRKIQRLKPTFSGKNFNSEIEADANPAAQNNHTVEDSESLPAVLHQYPRLDSRIILQNMEEVLDTVKKQHKEKHRRKKELKKLAMIEAGHKTDIVSSIEGELKEKKKEHSEKKHKHKDRDREKPHSKKKPLQDKTSVQNGIVLLKSPIKSSTILQHFSRTPKKNEPSPTNCNDELEMITNDGHKSENNETIKNLKPTNAFEVMMNARNKSIGSNTSGKEFPSPVADKELAAANEKRKLMLQEWAEKKGGAKRKLEEEERASYVEEQLEQRAKRFKQMLVIGAVPKASSTTATKTETKKLNKKKLQENTQRDKIKKRRGTRAQRLSSLDSLDSLEPLSPPKVDAETSEFMAKLNSPTKKRDSLLGYFPKRESPKELAPKQTSVEKAKNNKDTKIDTPQGKVKRITRKSSTPTVINQELQKDRTSKIATPSGRPRRSCAGKARYDYDLENSPLKGGKLSKNSSVCKTTTSKVNTPNQKARQNENSVNVIILDDSTNMSGSGLTTPQGTPKKLAPLFVRSIPKPSPDPEILKARKAFLQSGVPEKLRLEQEKQKQYEQQYEETTEIFPTISHIKQLSENELLVDKRKIKCSFKLKSEGNLQISLSPNRKSKSKSNKQQSILGTSSDCREQSFQKKTGHEFSLEHALLPSLANKRTIVKKWKTEFDRFPTYKCYNQMREKYRYFSAIDSAHDTEQVSESFVVTRQTRRSLEALKKKEPECQDDEYKPPDTAPNGELLFSEKYKPLLFEQVLVNLNPVAQLKEFLSNWSNGGTVSARNSQTLDDSMDLNDSTSQGPSRNTVVLLGPVSSGKTNAVFALANEMNFNVLEINAGMKRTGKRLIQELQEATQSHQIRKDASSSSSSQTSLLKMSLNGLKTKLKAQNSNLQQLDAQNYDSNSSDLSQSARKCLILIEDADIVLEQSDAGFTDAIYTLAASSKRPVIVVASNSNCAHLQRLISQNTIHFSSPNVLNISKFLAVLSLIENCPVQLDDLISLYLHNRRDLRKTLLELQFFIQSGGDRQRQLLEKEKAKSPEKENPNYFASPRKRKFSVEQEVSEASDNNVPTNDKNSSSSNSTHSVYMHRSLFEFYTVCQNSKWRIPFPINFHLLSVNLNDIFLASRKLKRQTNEKITSNANKPLTAATIKRKSKSPKKQWLTSATAKDKTPLDYLCSFYENLSVAALMSEQENLIHYQDQNKQKPSIVDRLMPNSSEIIAHCLLEKSIEINLEADVCPYNLFDTPKNCISLCDELGSLQLRSSRVRNLDYEPSIRSICRSEKTRATMERRSTRFYHYLRNCSINVCNFSTTHFDQACEAFQLTTDIEEDPTTNLQLSLAETT